MIVGNNVAKVKGGNTFAGLCQWTCIRPQVCVHVRAISKCYKSNSRQQPALLKGTSIDWCGTPHMTAAGQA